MMNCVVDQSQQHLPVRVYHESAVLKDMLFVWGGWTGSRGKHHSRLNLYSVNMLTGQWREYSVNSPVIPPPCDRASSAIIGNTIYSFGGEIIRSPYKTSDELYKMNLDEMKWKKVETTGTKPEGRRGAGMCSVNKKLVMMGGYGPLPSEKKHLQAEYKAGGIDESCRWNNELFEFDPQTGKSQWLVVLLGKKSYCWSFMVMLYCSL